MENKKIVAIGGMNHESNTFNPIITPEEDFVVLCGDDFVKKVGNSYNSAKGIYEALVKCGYEVVPTLFARAVPNGVVSKVFYEKCKKEMIERFKNIEHLDAITLSLHGSMSVESIGDAEGDLLKEIRKFFPNIPIFASLDMHTTITEDMVKNANGFVGYKTAPHIDTYQTGTHAAYLTHIALEENIIPYMSVYKMPILIAGEKSETSVTPMDYMIECLKQEEKDEDILAASYLLGFPWADNKNAGVSSLVVSKSKDKADKVAKKLAEIFWQKRSEFKFHTETYENEEALTIAFTSKERPLFLSDSGDNPTAGATGDSSDFLHSLINHKLLESYNKNILYSGFYSPAETEKCFSKKVGDSLEIVLGGHFDTTNGKPVKMNVTILKLLESYGVYNSKLALVKYKNIMIVLTSKHIGFGDDKLLLALDFDLKSLDIVILKLGYLEDCFKHYSKRTMMATSKGASCEILEKLNYTKVAHPIYPLDKDFDVKSIDEFLFF